MRTVSTFLAGLMMAAMISATTAFAGGAGHCGTYKYWDEDECECVDARGLYMTDRGYYAVSD